MARKSVIKGYSALNAVDISTNQESAIISTINQDKASIHVTWTGTSPVGILSVEARNGEKDPFYVLSGMDNISISGNSGEHVLIFNDLPFSEMKIVFTATSGTGSLTANLISKQVGG